MSSTSPSSTILERWSPFSENFGLVRADAKSVADQLATRFGTPYRVSVTELREGLADVFDKLQPIGAGHRILVIPTQSGWSAFFRNFILGSDPHGPMSTMARELHTVSMCIASTWPTKKDQFHQWVVYVDPEIAEREPVWHDRTLRHTPTDEEFPEWSEPDDPDELKVNPDWNDDGDPFPFEKTSPNEADRKFRFTREHFEETLDAVGIHAFQDSFFVATAERPAYLLQIGESIEDGFSIDEVRAGKPWWRSFILLDQLQRIEQASHQVIPLRPTLACQITNELSWFWTSGKNALEGPPEVVEPITDLIAETRFYAPEMGPGPIVDYPDVTFALDAIRRCLSRVALVKEPDGRPWLRPRQLSIQPAHAPDAKWAHGSSIFGTGYRPAGFALDRPGQFRVSYWFCVLFLPLIPFRYFRASYIPLVNFNYFPYDEEFDFEIQEELPLSWKVVTETYGRVLLQLGLTVAPLLTFIAWCINQRVLSLWQFICVFVAVSILGALPFIFHLRLRSWLEATGGETQVLRMKAYRKKLEEHRRKEWRAAHAFPEWVYIAATAPATIFGIWMAKTISLRASSFKFVLLSGMVSLLLVIYSVDQWLLRKRRLKQHAVEKQTDSTGPHHEQTD